jgi:chromosome partitioning protein
MILTVGNTKGGVGKSTLALNLAIARSIAGRRVWLVDGDRQGTATTSMAFRAQAGYLPLIESSHIPDGEALHSEVLRRRAEFDDVVIDAGGRDSTALRAALVLSNVLLIPFAPRSLDLWALQDVAALVDEARTINRGLRALAVLNGADVAGTDNEDAARALTSYPQLEYVPAPIRRRKSFANAAGMGLSVLEMKPKDVKAIAEVEALLGIVLISF